ncbi:MAG: transcriptional regulator [Solirubrobacterales bacterium]|jgi:DNA-binding transcriptional ArsR family regulator|nr:transcriptional regulator [Solirubrobacterales bacterium]
MPDLPRRKAEFFKSLGHPLRVRVLELLSERERTVSELLEEVEVEQPNLSQQLGILRRASLVSTRREGALVVYSLADPRMSQLLAIARQLLLDAAIAAQDELQHA